MSLSTLFSEFFALMTPGTIFNAFWATGFGIIVGMLPGLTATMGVALLTGLTFRFMPEQAMVVLISTYVGAIYGGSTEIQNNIIAKRVLGMLDHQ